MNKNDLFIKLIYIFLAVAFVVSHIWRPYPLDFIVKCLPDVVVLAACILYLRGWTRLLMSGACIASGIGDVALGLNRTTFFKTALIAYLVAHIFFAATFYKEFRFSRTGLAKALGVIAATAIVAILIAPRAEQLAIPVVVYIIGITAMAVGAAFLSGRTGLMIYIGTCAFICGDSGIALDKFLPNVTISQFVIFAFYYTALYLIVFGVCRYKSNNAHLS